MTTIPPNIITPRITTMLIVVFVIKRAAATPIRERGTANMIINGCHRLSNIDAIIIYTSTTAIISANIRLLNDSCICSLSPPSFTTYSSGSLSLESTFSMSSITLSRPRLNILAVTTTVLSCSMRSIWLGPFPMPKYETSDRGISRSSGEWTKRCLSLEILLLSSSRSLTFMSISLPFSLNFVTTYPFIAICEVCAMSLTDNP